MSTISSKWQSVISKDKLTFVGCFLKIPYTEEPESAFSIHSKDFVLVV